MNPRQLLAFVYSWCLDLINPEDRERWDIDLYEPMPGMGRAARAEAEDVVAEKEMAIFHREAGSYQ